VPALFISVAMTTETDISALRTLLDADLSAGLGYMNARVAHRFTAVYRIEDGFMRNVAIFDKQGDVVPEHLLAVPFSDSFCQFVLRDGFFKHHGLRDDRLEGHPYKGIVDSYVGLPLTDGTGLIGTFCHFDFPALPIAEPEFEFMKTVARILPEYIDPARMH
jgi:GAF domain-containing protein